MRMRRTFTFAAGWAVLTVLAAAAVWWGLGPLLAPIMPSVAQPAQSPARSPTPATSPPVPPSGQALSQAPPRPRSSRYEGWQFANGVFTQAFTTAGGTATVRIAAARVELVSSQARNGYRISTKQPSPERLVVEFFDGTHFFVLDAMWWESKPYAKITQVS